MNENKSLSEFINEQMEKFNIQDNKKNFLKLRQKFQRELKNNNLWDNPAEVKIVDKSKTKFFSKEQLDILYPKLETYLLKLSNINIKELEKYREQISKYNDYILSNQDKMIIEYEENPYKINITRNMKLEFMIEALFNKFFEPINIKQWQEDLNLNIIVDDADENWAGSIDVFKARSRLNDKINSYTKERK